MIRILYLFPISIYGSLSHVISFEKFCSFNFEFFLESLNNLTEVEVDFEREQKKWWESSYGCTLHKYKRQILRLLHFTWILQLKNFLWENITRVTVVKVFANEMTLLKTYDHSVHEQKRMWSKIHQNFKFWYHFKIKELLPREVLLPARCQWMKHKHSNSAISQKNTLLWEGTKIWWIYRVNRRILHQII